MSTTGSADGRPPRESARPLSRRAFLGITGGAAVTGAAAWAGLVHDSVTGGAASRPGRDLARGPGVDGPGPTGKATVAKASDRVLVVVQCGGGNDGLNTLVPLDGRYHDARPTLAIADKDVLSLRGEAGYGLHPSLGPLIARWDAGQLAAVESVGFPHPSRSHFEAMEWWWSATPGRASTTGWLGRWLDATEDHPEPLRAIALGDGSPALRSVKAISTAIRNPTQFGLRAPVGVDRDQLLSAFAATAQPLLVDQPLLAASQASVTHTLEAVRSLAKAGVGASGGASGSVRVGGGGGAGQPPKLTGNGGGMRNGGQFAASLGTAADLITHELGTRVIVIGVGGFDTHAGQVSTHQRLLADLAKGIEGFFHTLEQRKLADRALVLTTSEFGRRVAENGSGTDHGAAGVQFLIGPGVNAGVVGKADLAKLDEGDLRSEIDTRSLYAAALDWLGGPTDDILGGRYDRHSLLSA